MLSSEQQLAFSLPRFIAQTPNSCLMQLFEHLFIMLMFSSVLSQSRYKRSVVCHSVPVLLRAHFNPLQFFNSLLGRNHTISLPDVSMHPSIAFSPLQTGLDKCYTTHFRCKSTTSKRKTLLRLTETEHISFAPVMSTIHELQPTYNNFTPITYYLVVPTRNYHKLLLEQK